MPINPALVLGIQQPQIRQSDPMETYGKVMGLKAAQQQGEMQGMQMDAAKRAQADEAAVREAYTAAGGDSKVLRSLLQQRGAYKQLQALDKSELETQAKQATIGKDRAAAAKSEFEVNMGKLSRGAALLNEARDPESFAGVLRIGQMQGVFTADEVGQLMQQGYSPQLVQALKSAGVTRAQQLEQQHRDATLAETGRSNLARERNTVRGQDLNAQVSREGHGVTMRGQNMTDSRSREANAITLEAQQLSPPIEVTIGGRPALVQQNKSTGQFVDANTKQPVSGVAPKASDTEQLTSGYLNRMRSAETVLKQMESTGGKPEVAEMAGRHLPVIGGPVLENVMRSENRQKYFQAAEDWVRAKLRKESGAVIADEEMAREIRTYFPQLGDSQAVIQQKAAARKNAEFQLERAAGPASLGQQPAPPAAPAPAPARDPNIDALIRKYSG